MNSHEERDPSGTYEVNSRRAELAGYVLIAGLVLELLFAFVFHKEWPETVATVVAVLLIVGGVWGEIHFGRKARQAGDAQLAQFEARTAEANERAEEAKKQTAELQLELQREHVRVSDRHVTEEQKAILREGASLEQQHRMLPPEKRSLRFSRFIIAYLDGDREVGDLVSQIYLAVSTRADRVPLRSNDIGRFPSGISVFDPMGKEGAFCRIMKRAFPNAEFMAEEWLFTPDKTGKPTLYVGPKPL